jgi:hypothetical protein
MKRKSVTKTKSISTKPETYERFAQRRGRLSFAQFQEVLLNVWDTLTEDERGRHITSSPEAWQRRGNAA